MKKLLLSEMRKRPSQGGWF